MRLKVIEIFLLVSITVSCQPSALEIALKQSGSNRKELEKVLDYFLQKESDSLKYRAACFLIENMPGHYTFDGPDLRTYIQWADSACASKPFYQRKYIHTLPFTIPHLIPTLEKREDLLNISSAFLIRHISTMFALWQKEPWLKKLSFDEFCEYILPYRVSHEFLPTEEEVPDSLMQLENRIIHYYETLKYYPGKFLSYFSDYPWTIVDYIELPTIRYAGQTEVHTIDCFEIATILYWKLYLHHIPAAIDYIPYFPHKDNSHSWVSVIDYRYPNHHFTNYRVDKVAKVYRKTYSHHPIPHPTRNEFVPALFRSPFEKDVTELYTPTTDVTIKLQNPAVSRCRYAYLAVFNEQKWRPIAFAEIHDKTAVFNKMGRDIIYLPVGYHENRMMPVSYPVLLNHAGKVHTFVPDTALRRSVCLERKFPSNHRFLSNDLRLIGGFIEAANRPDFSDARKMCKIVQPSFMKYTDLAIPQSQPYRYWRIIQPNKHYYLSEIEFYENEKDITATGKPIQPSRAVAPVKTIDKDALSYNFIIEWMGMDFHKPVSLSKIRYLCRNDANEIYPGEIYELFYFDKNGWNSLGRQEATSDNICYDNVPDNALLWLRNINEGNEERIFTLENEEIKFW